MIGCCRIWQTHSCKYCFNVQKILPGAGTATDLSYLPVIGRHQATEQLKLSGFICLPTEISLSLNGMLMMCFLLLPRFSPFSHFNFLPPHPPQPSWISLLCTLCSPTWKYSTLPAVPHLSFAHQRHLSTSCPLSSCFWCFLPLIFLQKFALNGFLDSLPMSRSPSVATCSWKLCYTK